MERWLALGEILVVIFISGRMTYGLLKERPRGWVLWALMINAGAMLVIWAWLDCLP